MDAVGWALIGLLSIAWLVVIDATHEDRSVEPRRPSWLDYELAIQRRSDSELRALAVGKSPVIARAIETVIAERRRPAGRHKLPA